MPFKII